MNNNQMILTKQTSINQQEFDKYYSSVKKIKKNSITQIQEINQQRNKIF
jgi:N-acetylneuraminic acid mutarotase